MSEVHYTDPIYTERGDALIAASEQDQSRGWNEWLRSHLLIERDIIFRSIGEELDEKFAKDEAQRNAEIRRLELKLAECAGAVDVLRTGKVLRVRGAFSTDAEYKQFDVVMLDGSSFIAVEDRPGQCPGEGWRLLASAGRRGQRGLPGPPGPRGEPGENAVAVPGFKGFHLDPKTYTLSFIMTDGKIHALSLRELFQQFVSEMQGAR